MQGIQTREPEQEKLPEVEFLAVDRRPVFPEEDVSADAPEYLDTAESIVIEKPERRIERLVFPDKTDRLRSNIMTYAKETFKVSYAFDAS